jgi:small subunit ribosomal protein S6
MVESRNYEFAYHITTVLDEATIPSIHADVEALIQKHGGIITSAQQPDRKRLSYPIKHQTQSFFAWVQFSTDSDALLAELDEWARLHTEILRHVTLKLEPESDKRAIKQAAHLERKAAKAAKEGVTAVKKTAPETPAEDKGKMEKELEDVLGNL